MVGGSGEGAAMSPSSSSPGGGGKRGRDPEEDVYVDNLNSHKRYLSEIMASSLNGLSVGDSLADNIMESPARSESPSCVRDEIISQYSPMSEDSDDYRYFDTQLNPNGNQGDSMVSPSTSPMSSPHRFQKPQAGVLPSTPYPLPSCSLSAVACSHPRRGSENEGRFPSSPNDMCHGADLRRTALLRSVHMRVHGPHAYDLSFGGRQEQEHVQEHLDEHGHEHHVHVHEDEHGHEHHVHVHEDERGHEHLEDLGGSERSSCRKSIGHEATGYQGVGSTYGRQEHDIDYIDRCTSDDVLTSPEFKQEDDTLGNSDARMDKNR